MDLEKVDAIMRWPQPRNLQELQMFLELAGFYRKYICDYAKIAVPMTDQLKGQGKTFQWGPTQNTQVSKNLRLLLLQHQFWW